MSHQDERKQWREIGREGEQLLRNVHDRVLAVAREYDAHCKAHPEKDMMRFMAPLVAYSHDALRGGIGAWQHQSLVGVTGIARSLFEAVLIAADISKDPALAKRFLRYAHVTTLLDRVKDSTTSPEKRQEIAEELESDYPEWCRRDANGKVTGFSKTWRADNTTVKERAIEHGWLDAYDMLYADCSAYVHPTSLLGVLASKQDEPFVAGLIVMRGHYAAIFGAGTVMGLCDAFDMKPEGGPALSRLTDRFEELFNRAHALQNPPADGA